MRTPTPPSVPGEVPLITRIRAVTAGRYDIHSELGVGGMATVFRATERALEREVAIKVMSAAAATSPGAFERFRREARMAAALSHPHIVPIYAIGEDPSLAWFAMKFIEGRGLDSILKEGAQPLEMVTRTIGVVGRALQHAHENGVVHRDIKPANIMVGKDGWVYVTDFGIAKRDDTEALTQAGMVIGTPAYMSPEQFNGKPITGSADQYSLGIVAFEMLAGRAPFNAPSLGEIMRGHLFEPPPPLRTLRLDVPTGVAEVVNRMLEKEPTKRFPTLGDATSALEEAASGAKGGQVRKSSGMPRARQSVGTTPKSSPTTPIPRATSGGISTSAVRRVTAAQARPAQASAEGSSARRIFAGLLVVAALGWYGLRDRIAAAVSPAPLAEATVAVTDSATAPAAAPDSIAADSTSATSASSVDIASSVAINAAIADLAARVASAPAIDQDAPADSVVVQVGSQTLQTVLFVNGQQLGILGGRGLVPATVLPGAVSISVRKLNCRDWDTTFTALAGRRYTFVERSPRC